MKRKIIKLAEKTLVVSLPTEWLASQGMSKGDEVDVDVDDYRLVITPPQKILPHKKIEFDAHGITERVLRWKLSAFHKKGYDEITVINYTEEQNELIENLVRDLFVGFIIKEKSSLRIIVGQVAAVDVKEFDSTLRRAFRQLSEMALQLKDAFEKEDSNLLKQQLENEQVNNKLTNFCERLLNKYLKQKDEGHFWYVFAWNLEKIADNFKYIAEQYSNNPKITKQSLELYNKILSYLQDYTKILYDFDVNKLVALANTKKDLERDCLELLENGDKQDIIFLHYIHMIILQLADFSASMIAVKL